MANKSWKFDPQTGEPIKQAPWELKVEIWPEIPQAKATLMQNGKSRDITISAPILQLVLGWLKAAR
jgi:hypothetical protein